MTYPAEMVANSLALADEGRSATEIGKLLGVPRATVRGWMRGRVPRRTRPREDLENLPSQYVHLLGLYLGDGCLSAHPRDVYKLRISLDARYPCLMQECEDSILAVMPCSRLNRVDKGTWFEVYSYSKSWPRLFPQHGPGKKHERPVELTEWQWELVRKRPDLLLRGLLHSDGCRFTNTGRGGWAHPRYSFNNRSDGIRSIFCAACDLLGLRWTTSGERTIYVSRKDDVALLDLFVGPKR
jgi:hypothetical protein